MKKILAAFLILGLAVVLYSAVRVEKEPHQFTGKLYFGTNPITDAALIAQTPQVLVNGVLDNPTFIEGFDEGAAKGLATLQLDGTAFDGTTGVHNIAYAGMNRFVYASLGAGQTLNIAMTATGLDIGGDQAADEGYEIFSGTLGASGRPLVIGTDPAFKFCASVKIADVSGTDDFQLGFRRAETVNAAFDNYLDAATFSINAAAATAAIKLETIDDNAATTSTDTTDTWADGATKTLCVLVSSAGVVTYTNGGAAPTVTAAFTFDDGDPIIPFIRVLNDTDLAGTVEITSWEVAYQ